MFLVIFHNNLNMCFVHTIPMVLEYTINYLSIHDAFSYLVSSQFLYADYEDPWLIT